ncbi:acyltransferase [Tahibacter amnicola]|uniref:Acyltransferase n=1 Tax=Tahibacter amnicola TaxID=2976241 RepID=A0ABY6BPF2_9GAMM|nr:acyltransferase [Tahibacter amnicola]UXI70285.1 acyltransferase [Tahibacter amnicola]
MSIREIPRAVVAFSLIVVSTLVHATPLLLLALVKFVIPLARWRVAVSGLLVRLAESWVGVNSRLVASLTGTVLHVEGLDDLRYGGWYLVLCNHQSWADIPVLQSIFHRRIPFLKFFLKQQLIWVPVLGLAWWALDFPFMRRYTRDVLQRRPELRGKDIEATRRACAKFRDLPVSVMNFVEGTRYTPAKHVALKSPYTHLLPPRAGGVAFVLQTMGELLQAVVDVTIVYPGGRPGIWDLLSGRVREVHVHVRKLPMPDGMLQGDYENDPALRERFQTWINGLWAEKDARVSAMSR